MAVVLQLDLLVLHLFQLLALALRLTGEKVGRPTMLNYTESYQDWCLRLMLWHTLRTHLNEQVLARRQALFPGLDGVVGDGLEFGLV